MIKLLVAWYPRMAADGALLGPFAFYLVVGAVQASDRPKPYFDMLDDEVARWRKNTGRQKSQTMNMMIFGRRNESLLDPLGFPPKELSDFPENVHELLAAANDSPFRQIVNFEGGRNWDAKEVEALVQKTKDPTLRVYWPTGRSCRRSPRRRSRRCWRKSRRRSMLTCWRRARHTPIPASPRPSTCWKR